MWMLVFIYFYDAVPYVEKVSGHGSMVECFFAREALSDDVGRGNGYFDPGQQAICINMNESDI